MSVLTNSRTSKSTSRAQSDRSVVPAGWPVGRRLLGGWLLLTLLTSIQSEVFGQLNENCFVSILNRTAKVRSDGTWDLPSVPATFTNVRARATCVENGLTRNGQSGFFNILPDRMNSIAGIDFRIVDPVPETLTASSPTSTLTALGQTVQVTTTATFSQAVGGGTADVTLGVTGTNYTVSNPSFATLSADGLVTALATGTVLVSAMNDGALGVLQLQVLIDTGDSDGDGIPDDVEIAVGLDPNDPNDAGLDLDNDGLSNLDEFNLGTFINDADSDDDGILDGEEVAAGADGFVTNPLLNDTDGDGVRDALEIQTGSDPTDPASLNLPVALDAIQVDPPVFVLGVDELEFQASTQFSVVGDLLDGTTIDLTSAVRGTTYASNNSEICIPGVDGEVFSGSSSGTCTITIASHGFATESTGAVVLFRPRALSSLDLPGFANDVVVGDDYAYIAAGAAGLVVVDVFDRSVPLIVGSVDTPGNANSVSVLGTTVYLADGVEGLQIIDVTNPQTPSILNTVDTPGQALGVFATGTLAFIADEDPGLHVIDVADPFTAQIVGTVDTPGRARAVEVDLSRQIGVVADEFSGIQVVDLSDVTNPQIVSNIPGGKVFDLALQGNFVFVADVFDDLFSVDLTDPLNPGSPNFAPSGFFTVLVDVAVSGDFALGAPDFLFDFLFGEPSFPVYDVSNPATPFIRDYLPMISTPDFWGRSVTADDAFVYSTAGADLEDFGTVGDSRLHISQYLSPQDNDGVPPTVDITAPVAGLTVTESSGLLITVDATDDMGVAAVVFEVDGAIVFLDTTAPYQAKFSVPSGTGLVTIGVQALDFGGNAGLGSEVTVNVVPDALSTIVGRVLAPDASPVNGATVGILDQTPTVTAPDGTFTVAGVATVFGQFRVVAKALIEGQTETTASSLLQPEPGSLVDVGDLVLGSFPEPALFYPGLRYLSGGLESLQPVAGDVNGDGILDLVVADEGSTSPLSRNAIGVLLGQGAGTFQLHETIEVGPTQLRTGAQPPIALADLNGDNNLDLVAALTLKNDTFIVQVFLGGGAGGFQARATYEVGAIPESVQLVDFDGDGILDILTLNCDDGDLSLLLGRGDGLFEPQRRFAPAGTQPTDIAVGDFDGDSLPDVAVVNFVPGLLSVLRSTPAGTLELLPSQTLDDRLKAVDVGDFDADGNLDLAIAQDDGGPGGTTDSIFLLFGAGDGTFQLQDELNRGGRRFLVVQDLTRDGVPDLISDEGFNERVILLRGIGDGTFDTTQPVDLGAVGSSPVVADLDGDSLLDLARADRLLGGAVLLGDQDQIVFAEQVVTFIRNGGANFTATAAGDLDGNGLPDVVLASSNLSTPFHGLASILTNNGDGTFQQLSDVNFGTHVEALQLADLNGDNDLDLVTAPQGRLGAKAGSLAVAFGKDDGTFQTALQLGVDDTLAAVADVDEDGNQDILTGSSLLLGDGIGGFAAGPSPPLSGARAEAVADVDGDNNLDILAANTDAAGANTVFVLFGDGSGNFSAAQGFGAGGTPTAVTAADIDSDGVLDIIALIGTSTGEFTYPKGGVSVLFGDGSGAFPIEQTLEVGANPVSVIVEDLDGDSHLDIVTENAATFGVSLLLGQPGGVVPTSRSVFL